MRENENMRKRIITSNPSLSVARGWLDLNQAATVEVTSEEPGFPVEAVFQSDNGSGWRAGGPGDQQIRIIFDQPVPVHRIQLRFVEPAVQRTQEFSLRWFPESRGSSQEIVRQKWNFSPDGSTTETEDYEVNLDRASVLELLIQPALSGDAIATLASWRIG
jgi:hypothetical protein